MCRTDRPEGRGSTSSIVRARFKPAKRASGGGGQRGVARPSPVDWTVSAWCRARLATRTQPPNSLNRQWKPVSGLNRSSTLEPVLPRPSGLSFLHISGGQESAVFRRQTCLARFHALHARPGHRARARRSGHRARAFTAGEQVPDVRNHRRGRACAHGRGEAVSYTHLTLPTSDLV